MEVRLVSLSYRVQYDRLTGGCSAYDMPPIINQNAGQRNVALFRCWEPVRTEMGTGFHSVGVESVIEVMHDEYF